MTLRCAILDDYQNCALGFADWASLDGLEVKNFTHAITTTDELAEQLAGFEIIVAMRERTRFDAALFARLCQSVGVERAPSLDALLQRADVVTLHMVLSDSTRGMINTRELGLMKPTALLVNTSRGPLVDEASLLQALTQNRIAGAALDVSDTEPLPVSHPLRSLPNVVVTPHIGYVCRENYEIFYGDAVEDIQAWFRGSPVRTLPEPK